MRATETSEHEPYVGYNALAAYLRHQIDRSYRSFLELNRKAVLTSVGNITSLSPKILDNVWADRFLKEAKKILANQDYLTLKTKLKLERSQKWLIKYWEGVVNEFELLTGTSSCKVHNLRKRHSINYNEARTAILKSQGSELQEKQSSERKSKKRKVSTKKSELPSSRDEDDIEDENEKVEFDINIIIKQLKMQPTVEWRVDNINVSQRFLQYQQIAIDKLKNNGLKWDDTFEILALSSIIVLSSPCPYPNFTNVEWHKIIQENPYQLQKPIILPSISRALLEASRKHVVGEDSYMLPESSELSRAAARTFNDLQELPTLSENKLSESKHCCRLLFPYANPLFFGPLKEYETRLDRSVNGTRKRPDISCVVNGTPILNSEIKPLGHTPLQKKKDSVKAQLRAKKSVNEQLNIKGGPGETAILMNMGDVLETFFMDLKFSGLYRSWSFHTTRLAIDKPSMPLIESTFCHFVALERKVNELAENFKIRKVPFTPPLQILSFMNEIPDSPQINRLFG